MGMRQEMIHKALFPLSFMVMTGIIAFLTLPQTLPSGSQPSHNHYLSGHD